MGQEKRRYRRVSTSLVARIRVITTGEDTKIRLRSIQEAAKIRNISLGGIFLETAIPFPVGTYLNIDFAVPGYSEEIRTLGVVRWSNFTKTPERPLVGMGIEFLEVSTPHRDKINRFVKEAEGVPDSIRDLTKTPLHQNLLRLCAHKAGEELAIDALPLFLGCTSAQLRGVLPDFQRYQLIESVKPNKIKICPLPAGQLGEAIKEWTRKG
jgi:uncharacterized protein (TIGR02266 family)